jgi:hypothetical protein
MPIERICIVGRGIVFDAEYKMVELVDLAWRREVHLGFDLN